MRGFTLTELLIAVMVIGIVLAVSVPFSVNLLEGLKAGSAARSVAQVLNAVRFQAIARDQAVSCMIKQAPSATLFGLANPALSDLDPAVPPAVLSGGLQMSSPPGLPPPPELPTPALLANAQVMFNSRGVPGTSISGKFVPFSAGVGGVAGQTNGVIYLQSSGGRRVYAITLSAAGRVRVWQWGGQSWM